MRTDKCIFALGFFDGVHLGHQALLAECCRLAAKLDAQPAAITFDAHPKSLFLPEPPELISTVWDRRRLLGQYGMEQVYVFPVVPEVMSLPWQDFLGVLLDDGAAGFVCGDDFHFGYQGRGDGAKLQKFCEERDLPCVIVPEQTLDGVRISSTYIRSQLEDGDMATAVRFLGHPYLLTGTVVSGRRIGRTIGVPTANLTVPAGLVVPRFGVYACRTAIDGAEYCAVTNIGSRPTVGGHHVTVEPWILDFDGDLYGRDLTLEFYKFLRPERKFVSLEELRRQIRQDEAETRAYFK